MSTSATGLEIYNYPRHLQLALVNLQNNAKTSATIRQLILRFLRSQSPTALCSETRQVYPHSLETRAISLITVVVAIGAGYWLFYPKPTSEIVNQTSKGTSLEVSRRTSEQTLTTSTSSTANAATETTLWLNVTASKPVSYHISLLKSTSECLWSSSAVLLKFALH